MEKEGQWWRWASARRDIAARRLIFCSSLHLQVQCCGLGHPKDFRYHDNGFEAGRTIILAQRWWSPSVGPGGRAGGGSPVWVSRRGGWPQPPRAGVQSCTPTPAARGVPGRVMEVPWPSESCCGYMTWQLEALGPHRASLFATDQRFRAHCPPRQFLKS